MVPLVLNQLEKNTRILEMTDLIISLKLKETLTIITITLMIGKLKECKTGQIRMKTRKIVLKIKDLILSQKKEKNPVSLNLTKTMGKLKGTMHQTQIQMNKAIALPIGIREKKIILLKSQPARKIRM